MTVAAPAYLARAGSPRTPEDLAHHNCLAFQLASGRTQPFVYASPAGELSVSPRGSLVADDGQALVRATVAGLGVLQAHDYMVAEHLAHGELVELLADWAAPGPAISVISAPGRKTSPNVQAFTRLLIDVLGERSPASAGRERC